MFRRAAIDGSPEPTQTLEEIILAYVPPNQRPGFVAAVVAAPTHMTSGEVRHVFEGRGWVSGAGGDLYFNGLRTTAHAHLHMHLASGQGAVLPRIGRDVRISVTMLAWSAGNGGRNFIDSPVGNADAQPVANWQTIRTNCNMNAAMQAEVNWIMDYFTAG